MHSFRLVDFIASVAALIGQTLKPDMVKEREILLQDIKQAGRIRL